MRLLPADPDIETLVSRIRSGDLDLQPDFQRGEVWSDAKKRRLIDSILRNWHVPPIHVIDVAEDAREEVLDGQQRLVAIRDFTSGSLRVDGSIEPSTPEIAELHGLTYAKLPPEVRRRFDRFTIRVFKLVDYEPEEPGELFFRLNQPANLTAAEQRNAFFGPARQQIKSIVNLFDSCGLDRSFLGFSNSRMAYDDVVARTCLSLERGTLREKVTASQLTNRYRSSDAFPEGVIDECRRALERLSSVKEDVGTELRFNKATLYSWLCFLATPSTSEILKGSKLALNRFLAFFEAHRRQVVDSSREPVTLPPGVRAPADFVSGLFEIYNDRASSRVADVSSVLARDCVIWVVATILLPNEISSPRVASIRNVMPPVVGAAGSTRGIASANAVIEKLVERPDWGVFR